MTENPFDLYNVERVLRTLPNGRSTSWRMLDGDGKAFVAKAIDQNPPEARVRKWTKAQWRHVVLPFSMTSDDDGAFTVRDWIEGLPFSEIMHKRTIMPSEAESRREFAEICDALQRFHATGEAHGAIRPSNIIFTADGIVLTDPDPLQPLHEEEYYTRGKGEIVFSGIEHLNPEAWLEKRQLPSSDIYSLASLYVHWVTGSPLFAGDYPVLVCYQHLGHSPKIEPSERISPAMAEILNRALDKNPLERHEDAKEFAYALRDGLMETDSGLETSTQALVREANSQLWRPDELRTVLFKRHEIELGVLMASQYPDLPLGEARMRLLDALGDPYEDAPIPIVRPEANQVFEQQQTRGLPMPKTAPRPILPMGLDAETESVDQDLVNEALHRTADPIMGGDTERLRDSQLEIALKQIGKINLDSTTEAVDEKQVRAALKKAGSTQGVELLDEMVGLLEAAVKKGPSHSASAGLLYAKLKELGLDPEQVKREREELRQKDESSPTLKRRQALEEEHTRDPWKIPFIVMASYAALVTILFFVNLFAGMTPPEP